MLCFAISYHRPQVGIELLSSNFLSFFFKFPTTDRKQQSGETVRKQKINSEGKIFVRFLIDKSFPRPVAAHKTRFKSRSGYVLKRTLLHNKSNSNGFLDKKKKLTDKVGYFFLFCYCEPLLTTGRERMKCDWGWMLKENGGERANKLVMSLKWGNVNSDCGVRRLKYIRLSQSDSMVQIEKLSLWVWLVW